ncbi:MAG: alpha/beta hydrolase [Actinobacteria bacterium]|nr:alpha/beta hydrolase [Actinomycetota bacterium]
MFAPGGFNATVESWSHQGIYQRLQLVGALSESYTCVLFDRREAGRSGGRVERLGWPAYVRQARGLLDHLGIDHAHLMGGCVGCSTAAAFATLHPDRVRRMVLYSPAGGARYRLGQQARFARHQAFVAEQGLAGVVALARRSHASFSEDPRLGLWASVIRQDAAFADRYAALDPERYQTTVAGIARAMFDRDSVPGVEPEDLMALEVPALVVPGQDASHAISAARFLQECIPGSEYWDMPVGEQTADNAAARIHHFLQG